MTTYSPDKLFKVTKKAQRPANMNGKCFYCHESIGSFHKTDCVLVSKIVRIRVIIDYPIKVPSSWDAYDIEFHRNEGSWCSSSMIKELKEWDDGLEKEGKCPCNVTKFLFVSNEPTEIFLDE